MTLADLNPGDVATFDYPGADGFRFVLTHDRRCLYPDGSSICVNAKCEVTFIGRGRYVPPQPGRIELTSEAAR